MATYFRNKVITDVGTSPVQLLQTASNNRFTVVGLNIANTTTAEVQIDIMLTDETSITAYYIKSLIIPPKFAVKAVNNGEKLIIAPDNELKIRSNLNASVDVIVSYVEIV